MIINNVEYINSISVTDYNILRKSVGWNEIAINQAQTGINNSTYIVVAVCDNKTVGMTRLVSDGGYICVIVDVIVLPEFQGKGIGKTMMSLIMEYINGSIDISEGVFINLMSAEGRESFYKQFGFIERPNDHFGAGMSQWISKFIEKWNDEQSRERLLNITRKVEEQESLMGMSPHLLGIATKR